MRLSRFIFLAVSGETSTYRWLLASPNNRELGRGANGWPSYQACRDDVTRVQGGIGQVESSMATDAIIGQWTWRVSLADIVVARSARYYQRERECRYSLNAFLTAVPTATLVDGVRQIDPARRGGKPRAVPTDELSTGAAS
ncbi:hypothetical protein ACQHIV_37730 [Kribbella sp. GL6]|uniref:hypothetical protein n=1 Tax=Kribbella sp. GL6 TaxID=3419765 RepID=UPI003D022A06